MSGVLGIGNALVDVLIRLESDELLNKLSLPKGSMQLVDETAAQNVLLETAHLKQEMASGGSAANAIHGLAMLGVKTGFIGKVGDDELGQFFTNDMSHQSICTHINKGLDKTGKAIALISPDSERTFATFLGAAIEVSAQDLSEDLFDGYTYFHIEGYLVQNEALIERALQLAKQKGLITSIDLASFNVVLDKLDFLTRMVAQYVDIVFANEEEAKAFTGKEAIEALALLGANTQIAVLKLGKNGSLIKRGNEIVEVGVIPATSIDTTGAGDLYAAGFLYGLEHKLPLALCGQVGAILSGHVIEGIGPKMNEATWQKIKQEISAVVAK